MTMRISTNGLSSIFHSPSLLPCDQEWMVPCLLTKRLRCAVYALLRIVVSACLFACTGCSRSAGVTVAGTVSSEAAEPVEVSRGQLVPTASSTSTVLVSQSFAVVAPRHGVFRSSVADGDYVAAGHVLGTVDGEPLMAVADGVVESLSPDNDVAFGYPLMYLRYGGMSSQVDASSLLRTSDVRAELSGRFQVAEGQGPTDCMAVVPAGSDMTTGETAEMSDATVVQCLFPKDTEAIVGQNVVTVLTASAVEDVLLLPLSAVAGRAGHGQVLRKTGDEYALVDVSLGASDGTSVVILDGLSEGDLVSSVAPNLIGQEEMS